MYSLKRLLFVTLTVAAAYAGLSLTSAYAQNSDYFTEDNLRLLDVRFERYRLGNGTEGYLVNEQVYLALVDMVALLELPIDVGSISATGRIKKTGKEFNLTQSRGQWQLTINNKPMELGSYDIVEHNDVIFVASAVLELWLPITIEQKLAESYIKIDTSEGLPFQESLARRERVFDRGPGVGNYEYPLAQVPYSFWQTPSVDMRFNHSTTRNTDTDETTARNTNYSVITNGDIGFMNANTFLTGNRDNGVNTFSARFSRFDSENNLLGPLKLSQISFGDISSPGVRSSYGRGLLVSNQGNSNRFVQDLTVIEGNHYPGWEVELYLGDTVVDYLLIGDDGQYRFSDVILSQGVNDYRLVFYGPAGEREQENRPLFLGEADQDLRRLRYSFAINQPNTRVYQASDTNNSQQWQANFASRMALFKGFTLNAAYSSIWLDESNLTDQQALLGENQEEYFQVGANANWGGHSFQLVANKNNNDPYSLAFALGGDFRHLDYRFRYEDFRQEDDASAMQSQLNTVLRYRLGGVNSVLDWRRSSFEGYEQDDGQLFFSGRYKGLNWSKGFDYERSWNGQDYDEELAGQLFAGYTVGPLTTRVNSVYTTLPETELVSVGLANTLRVNNDLNFNFNFSHNVERDLDSYTLGMKWQLPFLVVNPTVSYTEAGFVRGNLNLLMTMGSRTGTLGDYYSIDRRSTSSRGTVRARLFEDENGDGRYTRGERLLSGGIIHSLQTRQKAESDEVGVAQLTNVRAWFPSDIVYESDTVEDFSLRYGGANFAIEARPGKVIEIDMPFYRAGDIDGVVLRQYRQQPARAARGVTVELISSRGEIISTTVSASDGFYSFEKVLPGSYRVRIRGEQMLSGNEHEIIIGREGNFVGDFNITIASRGNNLQGSENTLAFLSQQPNASARLVKQAPIEAQPLPIERQALSAADPGTSVPAQSAAPSAISDQPQTGRGLESAPALNDPIQSPQASVAEQLTVIPAVSVSPVEARREERAPVPPVDRQLPVDPWSLQLGSYSQLANVQALTQKLQAKDTPFFTQSVSTANGDFTRVFAGPYYGRAAALQAKADLDQQFNVRSFPVAVGE